ncbi:hypothetical protein QJ043_07030 [Olsenella sp. YH-ols2217]|uniref:Uncharacterized protein n=1 Tax=Kribbibacterium absianum TaxID=3044210 RepID=A0ABT6ZLA2_9ACTN|nr:MULTISPECIES: hypothetical protein [unclassified Olsenella]MDJ1121819.1 hypothetical protein [Olsenella sp. YH-ols2216]MDJ1129827.1 hypothetical protein [Olsenella sp. YH-ols2217]
MHWTGKDEVERALEDWCLEWLPDSFDCDDEWVCAPYHREDASWDVYAGIWDESLLSADVLLHVRADGPISCDVVEALKHELPMEKDSEWSRWEKPAAGWRDSGKKAEP